MPDNCGPIWSTVGVTIIRHFSKEVEDLINNRKKNVVSFLWKLFNKTIISWRPHIKNSGVLFHISYIYKKSESLGKYFRNEKCSKYGIILYIDVKRGNKISFSDSHTVFNTTIDFRTPHGHRT